MNNHRSAQFSLLPVYIGALVYVYNGPTYNQNPFRMTTETTGVVIRTAKREDCRAITDLRWELAVHQHLEHLPMVPLEDLERDGFDVDPPYFQCLVAEETTRLEETGSVSSKIVGYALYGYAYAAWEGRTIVLGDICVSKQVQQGGIGSKLIKELAKIALRENCARIQFEVLEWNPARKFYDSLGGWNTTEAEGWHNFRLGADAIKKLATS